MSQGMSSITPDPPIGLLLPAHDQPPFVQHMAVAESVPEGQLQSGILHIGSLVPCACGTVTCLVPSFLQEATTLRSVLATSLLAARCPWPAFLPVHDPRRDGYMGIQVHNGSCTYFDADSMHGSGIPPSITEVC